MTDQRPKVVTDQPATRTYNEITPSMRAFIGTREVLRRIGYRADDLYCMTARSAKLRGAISAFCVLRTQGKEFSVELGAIDSEPKFADEYKIIAYVVNAGGIPKPDLDRMYNECEARQNVVDLVMAIQAKGILLPSEMLR